MRVREATPLARLAGELGSEGLGAREQASVDRAQRLRLVRRRDQRRIPRRRPSARKHTAKVTPSIMPRESPSFQDRSAIVLPTSIRSVAPPPIATTRSGGNARTGAASGVIA